MHPGQEELYGVLAPPIVETRRDRSVHLTLGGLCERSTGANDHVRARNALRAVRDCGNCVGTA